MKDHMLQTQYAVVVGQAGSLSQSTLTNMGVKKADCTWLAPETAVLAEIRSEQTPALKAALQETNVDWLLRDTLPVQAKLFLADMDSTMITIECIDELADYAGIKAEVSAVTQAAMRGDLDFEAALRERVALLEGLNVNVLDACFKDEVRFTPGGETAVKTMAQHGAYCALVSGGFTYFTQRVARQLGFHEHRANVLEERDGRLTGKVRPPISNAQTKLSALQRHSERLKLTSADTLAIGDGANDIPMLQAAGLGVAYRAKPKTKAAVDCAIDHTDLTTLLYFQGIPKDRHLAS